LGTEGDTETATKEEKKGKRKTGCLPGGERRKKKNAEPRVQPPEESNVGKE